MARWASSVQDQRAAITAGDSAWLSARQPVCARAFHGGETIDEIDTAGCLLAESTARLDAVKGITPPEADLKSTDSTDPSALSWYTTPEGSRIAMLDTQGDSSGGVIIAWVIIGGARGFLVNPAQFTYVDGSFTDHGKVQASSPGGHRVPSGAEYQFDIDYRHLSADPNASLREAGSTRPAPRSRSGDSGRRAGGPSRPACASRCPGHPPRLLTAPRSRWVSPMHHRDRSGEECDQPSCAIAEPPSDAVCSAGHVPRSPMLPGWAQRRIPDRLVVPGSGPRPRPWTARDYPP